ncbi:MAG: OadG family transporter subunit [Sphaerochaetaceae bacterium]|jgi:oxaloacetate decarboxylase gamma subunit|nr:OadG family protein [Sphaerochaetaceae bacterium]MDD2405074.1 OadG family transporter subunit [Sphaerochaetaceae bacterium]MDD3671154.1 OadG family transporter subunit [Sphaerochaetaceae bacterium]MDD4258625.1 OadG family transporter subunit [Sphaerochaetaceae bacterium]MDD4763918.1 OadG family transporter subunit [Sphaerochaetaceae bacterium]
MHQLPRELLLIQMENGLILLVLGMGVVFLFLLLLVASTKLLSFVVGKLSPLSKSPITTISKGPEHIASGQGPEVAAAIAAAIAKSKR